jgi:peptidoglycan hydrolase CwlO-like protein
MTYLEHEIFLSKLSHVERTAYDLEREIKSLEREIVSMTKTIEKRGELLAVLKRGLSK